LVWAKHHTELANSICRTKQSETECYASACLPNNVSSSLISVSANSHMSEFKSVRSNAIVAAMASRIDGHDSLATAISRTLLFFLFAKSRDQIFAPARISPAEEAIVISGTAPGKEISSALHYELGMPCGLIPFTARRLRFTSVVRSANWPGHSSLPSLMLSWFVPPNLALLKGICRSHHLIVVLADFFRRDEITIAAVIL